VLQTWHSNIEDTRNGEHSHSSTNCGALYAILHDRFWKSDHDFLIAFHSNFSSGMHGFRDNEVLLPARYDVIVISPPGVALRSFAWRILKERPWPPKLQIREKHLLGGHFLTPNCVFWAIVREIIAICLACAGTQEKKAGSQAGRKKSVYFTYAWSEP